MRELPCSKAKSDTLLGDCGATEASPVEVRLFLEALTCAAGRLVNDYVLEAAGDTNAAIAQFQESVVIGIRRIAARTS